jgi:hypothetical protein
MERRRVHRWLQYSDSLWFEVQYKARFGEVAVGPRWRVGECTGGCNPKGTPVCILQREVILNIDTHICILLISRIYVYCRQTDRQRDRRTELTKLYAYKG